MSTGTIRLLISCPDARGIIAAVANFIALHDGNILDADQHSDPHSGEFFMRTEIDPAGFGLRRETFAGAWQPVADRFKMRWRVHWGEDVKRMALLVSREDHCLNDLLWRWRTGELAVEIPFVISNHDLLRGQVRGFGVVFQHLPVAAENRAEQEARVRAMVRESAADFIVLARYMQVLSPEFVAEFPERIINIHHSFLPAFAGRRPYHQAFERGVKIIGATSHYVTNELDEGPIIAQSTTPVDHRDTIEDLIRKGRDLERMVLSTAVRQHLEDRIIVSQNKTVVFD
jgi:formyltetrahydrofolate deformylase